MSEFTDLDLVLDRDWRDLTAVNDHMEGFTVVAIDEGVSRRWSRTDQIIVRGPSGTHYAWYLEVGLTEMQDTDRFDDAIDIVEPHTETITVTTWKAVK